MSVVVREHDWKDCARWHPTIARRSFGRLIDVDSASLRGLPVLKVLPLGFPRADWRLEKREFTTYTHIHTFPTLPRYKIPR